MSNHLENSHRIKPLHRFMDCTGWSHTLFVPRQPREVEIWIVPILQVRKVRKLNLRLNLNFPKYSDHRSVLFELYHVLTQHLGAAQRQTLLPEITQAWIKETGGLDTCMSDNQCSKSRTNSKHAEGPRIISAFTLKGALEFICSSFFLPE